MSVNFPFVFPLIGVCSSAKIHTRNSYFLFLIRTIKNATAIFAFNGYFQDFFTAERTFLFLFLHLYLLLITNVTYKNRIFFALIINHIKTFPCRHFGSTRFFTPGSFKGLTQPKMKRNLSLRLGLYYQARKSPFVVPLSVEMPSFFILYKETGGNSMPKIALLKIGGKPYHCLIFLDKSFKRLLVLSSSS